MLRILNTIGHTRLPVGIVSGRDYQITHARCSGFRFPHPWLTGLNVYMNTGIHPMVSRGLPARTERIRSGGKTSATFYSTQMETHNSI
jgi:hypothetical protein